MHILYWHIGTLFIPIPNQIIHTNMPISLSIGKILRGGATTNFLKSKLNNNGYWIISSFYFLGVAPPGKWPVFPMQKVPI